MCIFKTSCQSLTGQILYSDTYAIVPAAARDQDDDTSVKFYRPFLNEWAGIPFIGNLAGVVRCALAIIHMIGHIFAALIFWDAGHLGHAFKGGTEFLRGTIEATPIAGRLFVWFYDAPGYERFISMPWAEPQHRWSFFIIKIYNPQHPDRIDRALDNDRRFNQVAY